VVGADGIHSQVRSLCSENAKDPLSYLGYMLVLGMCPLGLLTEHPLLDSSTVFQTVNGTERMYMMPYNEKTIMWQASFPLDESEALALRSGGQKRLKEEVLARFSNCHDPIPDILSSTIEADITGYPAYDRPPGSPGVLGDSHQIILIGDAAHPMSPFKGQGANQALLDALLLARMIYRHATVGDQQDASYQEVLDSFEKEMFNRTRSKVLASAHAARVLHSDVVLKKGDHPRGK